MPKGEPWRYEKLTWPEINDAVKQKKVVVVPIGSVEQHGPHLPIDVDMLEVTAIATGAAKLIPDDVLVMPTQCQGYTAHVMDFPGTINIHWETLINFMVDIGKSLAYHGFKKIVYVNGHGSNAPNMDLASRRVNLETDAESIAANWWSFLNVDPGFAKTWRESVFPGGCAHACELETSLYLYLAEDDVRKEKIENGYYAWHEQNSKFQWVDLWGAGPGTQISWTASYSDSGIMGESLLGTKEKGERVYKEATRQLAAMIQEFRGRKKYPRGDHHATKPTFPMPWGQGVAEPTKMGNVHNEYVRYGPHGKNGKTAKSNGKKRK
jgi:creatinine amidohydrolase